MEDLNQDVHLELAELRARLAQLEGQTSRAQESAASASVVPSPQFGRRQLLRRAGVVAAGAAAVTVAGSTFQQAAAANNDALLIGNAGNFATTETMLKVTGPLASGERALFGVTDGTNVTAPNVASIVGLAGASIADIGVAGYTSRAATIGAGVLASGPLGILALSNTTHLKLSGPGRDNALLPTTAAVLAGVSFGGEITYDRSGNLWLGVGGTGNFRKLAGNNSAGAFHSIAPARVFDSRPANGGPGKLNGGGGTRDVQVAGVAGVPTGIRAILGTLTITDTDTNFGFLTIAPGGTPSTSSSSINWSIAGQTIANTVASGLNAAGQVRFFNNSPAGANTNYILDVVGYYL